MFQKLWNFNILYLILLFVCGIQTVAFFFVSDRSWFYVSLFLFVALLVLVLLRLVTVKQKLNHLINSMNDEQSNAISNALTTFTLPVLIVSDANEIVWYNQYFSETVSADSDLLIGKNIEDVLGASGLATLEKEDRATISYVNRIFDVYLSTHLWENDTKQKILFFVFWQCYTACGILILQQEIKPTSPASEAWNLNHWIAREVPLFSNLMRKCQKD